MIMRSAFGYDVDEVSDETGLECKDESLAIQSAAEECDINTLVKRFGITGELPVNVRAPITSDFVGLLDFKDAMNAVRASQESFMEMPADVRSRFHNDVNEFVNFCSVDANRAEAEKLGLVVPRAAPVDAAPLLVKVVPDVPAKPV